MTRRDRDDSGSIVVATLVIFVATALVITTAVVIQQSLRVARRSGDSANALQLADAAVNDAVKAVASASGTSISNSVTLAARGGSYSYVATLDSSSNVWHVDASGTDSTGVRRHVRADAVPETLVGNAYFANSNVTFPAGTSLDSFQNGSSPDKMCTRHGYLGSNDLTVSWPNSGGGTGVRNCVQSTAYSTGSVSWPYPMDGCTFYAGNVGDPPPTIPNSNFGAGKCPDPPATTSRSPRFVIPDPPTMAGSPESNPASNPNNTCDGSHPLVSPGQALYWSNVNIIEGCRLDVSNGPIVIVTPGNVVIGAQNGNAGVTDAPDTSNPAICPSYGGQDFRNNPAWYYCPGWSRNLQIFMSGGGNVSFGNHSKFWGVIIGSQASVGGGPQAEIWGALLTGGTAAAAQYTMHYDEALGDITTGRYVVANWREEPVQ